MDSKLNQVNRSRCVEIQNRLKVMQTAANDFVQFASHLDMSYDAKLLEIQNLDNQISKLKDESSHIQEKANKVLQDAQATSDKNQLEMSRMMDEMKKSRFALEEEKKLVQMMKQESDAIMAAAIEKQKMADAAFVIVEERKKRLEAAIR